MTRNTGRNNAIAPSLTASRALVLAIDQQLPLLIEHCQHTQSWQAVIQLANTHFLTAHLAQVLQAYKQQLPNQVAELCDAVCLLNTNRNLAILKSTNSICLALNQRDITPMLLKGAALLARTDTCREALTHRMQSDIDILIQPEQIPTAVEVLYAQGYEFGHETTNTAGERQLTPARGRQLAALQRRYKHHHHLPALIKEGTPCSVEIHRRCASKRFRKKLVDHTIFDTGVLTQLKSAQAYVMPNSQQFAHWLYHDYIGSGQYATYQIPYRLLADWQLLGRPDVANDKLFAQFSTLAKQLFTLNRHVEFDGATKHLLFQKRKQLQPVQRCYQMLLQQPTVKARADVRKQLNHAANLWYNPGKIWQRL